MENATAQPRTRRAVYLPSCSTLAEVFTWIAGEYNDDEVLSVHVYRGPDGLTRGSVMVRGEE